MSEKKPSERIRELSIYGISPLRLLAYLDEVEERLAKLERIAAQNPIGETEHGDRVFGYEPEPEGEEG